MKRHVLLLTLTMALVLAACGGDDDDDTALDNGTHIGFLMAIDQVGEITLDQAEMLGGEEAVDAARNDGQLPEDGTLPNDFYIDNDETDTVALRIADAATVELYDCSAACELGEVGAADFLSGEVEPFGGSHALVEVDVEQGEVVALREIYVP